MDINFTCPDCGNDELEAVTRNVVDRQPVELAPDGGITLGDVTTDLDDSETHYECAATCCQFRIPVESGYGQEAAVVAWLTEKGMIENATQS